MDKTAGPWTYRNKSYTRAGGYGLYVAKLRASYYPGCGKWVGIIKVEKRLEYHKHDSKEYLKFLIDLRLADLGYKVIGGFLDTC